MPWSRPSPDRPARRRWRSFALVLVLALLAGVTLVMTHVAPSPNGLGVLPSEEAILNQSGLALETPHGTPAINAGAAVKAATKSQPESEPEKAVLATVVGGNGSAIAPPGRLCWIVFLNPGSDSTGDAPVPGQVDLDAVLVNAQSGGVIEGFISFHGTTAHSEVGTE
ncbi:MAG: hypothetical protein WA751_03035 [Candidatus Dormiibacterota bacterium]